MVAKKGKAKQEKIDFKHNLKVYFGFLKNYKLLIFGLVAMIAAIEVGYLINKFLFKLIVDKGAEFTANALPASDFIRMLITIAVIFGIIVLALSAGKWLRVQFVN